MDVNDSMQGFQYPKIEINTWNSRTSVILLISRMLNSEGSCGIMSLNYSTQGLKDTSHLKTVRLIGFMQNYKHEQLNSTQ